MLTILHPLVLICYSVKRWIKTLSSCVALKKEFPNLLISSTGGVNESNIQNFVKIGVDFIVTSAPYHAKPVDIRVDMSVIE